MSRVLFSVVLSLPLIGAYGIFAIGIVLIYRASRMLNLAHGAMAMVPAYLLYAMVRAGLPLWLALGSGILGGGLLGFLVEKLFVSRLRAQGSTAQTVGTVAALGVLVSLVARIFGTSALTAPPIFPQGGVSVGLSTIQFGEIGLFGVLLVVSLGLYLLISRTDLGLMMRGTAESRLAASLMGVNPSQITSFTWILGGSLAALAGILLASVTVLHPYTLALQVLPAFIAALIGGLGSLPGALIGAAIVGVTQGIVPVLGPLGEWQGAPQLFLALVAIVVMAFRGRTMSSGIDSGETDARTAAPKSQESKTSGEGESRAGRDAARSGSARRRVIGVAVVATIVFPFVPKIPSSVIASGNIAARYALFAISLVLLTGWVGQISLGHASLVGVGAYVTGHVVAILDLPFPLSLPLAAAASAIAAGLLGAVALRVRGLYLAVASLVFSWMASEFLFRQEWFIGNGQIPNQILGIRGSLPFFDLTNRRTFYFVVWGVTALVVMGAANIRDSKTGRAFFALRGSEMAAASLGVDVMRYKLLAFAVSGAIAGMAGNLVMTDSRVVTADQFTFSISLFILAVAVVGGLHSLGGAIASGLLFAALGELFFRVPRLGDFLEITSSLLLAVTLVAFSGGLASIPGKLEGVLRPVRVLALRVVRSLARRRGRTRFRRSVRSRPEATPRVSIFGRLRHTYLARRLAGWTSKFRVARRAVFSRSRKQADAPIDFAVAMATAAAESGSLQAEAVDPSRNGRAKVAEAKERISQVRPKGSRYDRRPLVEAEKVTVRFGGLVAVNEASLEVREGEIVGLIGPNGAGKTTLFNAIAGYNSPAAGTIRLHGVDVTKFPVHRRAQLGVARTFQLIQLLSQLSVYQNLLVATHVHNPTGFLSHLIVSGKSIANERAARARVDQILELLELKDIAGERAGDLPFGVLRMVEVARALVTGFRVAMLDEPASGLDNTETDRLMEVLRFVRGLGVTILLIEHDVRMVTGVSDYMYVLDQGEIIAEGPPEQIQRDLAVIAAYLGEPAKEAVG